MRSFLRSFQMPKPNFVITTGVAIALVSWVAAVGRELAESGPGQIPDIANPSYMVDNKNNWFNAAPDQGTQNGPVWLESGSFENYMTKLNDNKVAGNSQKSSYWLTKLAPLGQQPLAGQYYKFYRDVVSDYGADPTGKRDSTEAINAAVQDGNRCGMECGTSFTYGAIVYFPPGTYKICRPIIQLYHTQFIGDAIDPPTIKGCDKFQGIALIDTNPYIPGGNGASWYAPRNQFFRQIRNLIFDLKDMPLSTDDGDQEYVPTGIHWQVAQATSLQNLVFNMPVAKPNGNFTHVGIFTESGSGGFVSDLVFNGGSIGWRAGSQQYTARNLEFNDCLNSIQMAWNWGFNWQGIKVDGGSVAFNISGYGGDNGRGTGSVSIIDCSVQNVPVAILTTMDPDGAPSVVIDNLVLNNVQVAVQNVDDASILLLGDKNIDLWALGRRYNGSTASFNRNSSTGSVAAGPVGAPRKPKGLLGDNKALFVRSRPQYEKLSEDDFLVATKEKINNNGTGNQTELINKFLKKAVNESKITYFPAGIYAVGGTVFIPTNSRIQGSGWAQIMGSGSYFSDWKQPRVMVQVGNPGDTGTMEITEMLFTVKGNTSGIVLMEWNVHEKAQGSAGMWDSHFRVGGARGTDLDFGKCPKHGMSVDCTAGQLMLHVTPKSSGYFENVWAWAADHDGDMSVYGNLDLLANQVTVYFARGILIESAGPSWFYGTSSEHCVLYQYQLHNASNIYLGHIQTETPYYQPYPVGPKPFVSGATFPADPSFNDCKTEGCKKAWALRIINSDSITIHSAGMYSLFHDYEQYCVETSSCQDRLIQIEGSKDIALFNMFTIGSGQVTSVVKSALAYENKTENRLTTEISVYQPPSEDAIVESVSSSTSSPRSKTSTKSTTKTTSPTNSTTKTTSPKKTPSSSSKTTSTKKTKTTSSNSLVIITRTTDIYSNVTVDPSPTPHCNDSADKCKLDRGNACSCDENGCTADSPACCANNSCPNCDCDENGKCTADSPICCAGSVCQWACYEGTEGKRGCPGWRGG